MFNFQAEFSETIFILGLAHLGNKILISCFICQQMFLKIRMTLGQRFSVASETCPQGEDLIQYVLKSSDYSSIKLNMMLFEAYEVGQRTCKNGKLLLISTLIYRIKYKGIFLKVIFECYFQKIEQNLIMSSTQHFYKSCICLD